MASMDDAMQTMLRNLEKNTGKPVEQWTEIVRKSGKQKHGEIVKMLKSEHGLTHGYANLVAHRALESDASFSEADDLIASQYSGKKAELRPIYDTLISKIQSFGKDVEIAPKKGYVSLRRSKQFGIIQPSTATRVDVGINLKGEPPTERLEPSGSFNAMVSHRVRVEKKKDVDAELVGYLRKAYEQS